MWLKSIHIQKFRNYKGVDLQFHSGLNIFLGQNAQGKTNLLESIYFLALTRSHRTRSDKDLIHFQEEQFTVSGVLEKKTGSIPLEISLSSKGRVTKVNHLKQSKLSTYIGNMNVVLFAPEDLQLVKGSPALRRKFIDIDLGQMKPVYLSDLTAYHHVLKQRNSYLKTANTVDPTFLDVLDEQLADYGSRVCIHRKDFLKKLEDFGQEKHFEISNQTEKLSIRYDSSISFQDEETLRQTFITLLRENRTKDLIKKTTSVGPHRDDISFYINDMNATFGSQGQHRSVVLSLKLAEISLIESLTNEKPILLLDDVMSELDNNRQLHLLEVISRDIQTFITTTTLDHLKDLPEDLKIFNIHSGHVDE